MTTAEAKYACETGAMVMFHEAVYRAVAITSIPKEHKWHAEWYNSLRLIPINGARSTTEARMCECRLLQPMPEEGEQYGNQANIGRAVCGDH